MKKYRLLKEWNSPDFHRDIWEIFTKQGYWYKDSQGTKYIIELVENSEDGRFEEVKEDIQEEEEGDWEAQGGKRAEWGGNREEALEVEEEDD